MKGVPLVQAPAVALIDLRGLGKRYGERATQDGPPPVEVLRGIDLQIHSGEFVAIMGASGSGKSTLMHLLGCLDKPTSGTYRFNGEDVSVLDADSLAKLRREAFGFIFQSYHLVPTESAQENVEIPALYAGLPKAKRAERAKALLTKLGLGNKLANRPRQLSGGQQQRVSIARALMNGGRVILADEPTGALDTQSGAEVMGLLHELASAGHTIILITHDSQVARQAHRVLELRDGEIVSDSGRTNACPITFSESPDMIDAHLDSADSLFDELGAALRAAWKIMWVNRFRTCLTLLGIIIGVASVTVMIAIGSGSQLQVMDKMAAFGARTLQVWPQWGNSRTARGKITLADMETIRRVPNVETVTPYIEGQITVRRGNIDHGAECGGTTVEFLKTLNWRMAQGTFFTNEDGQKLRKVVVLGQTVHRKLFPRGVNSVGQDILLDSVPFQVIGVLQGKGADEGQDQDNRVLVPFQTASVRLFGHQNLTWIGVLMRNLQVSPPPGPAIEEALAKGRRTHDLQVWDRAEAIRLESETGRTMTLMLGLIAAISLVVGGIGVMNVMLMAVRERTREIGIRIATGARQIDILRQFLCEAVLITVVGGVIGVGAGLLTGAVLWISEVPLVFSWAAMLVAFLCAVCSGLIFGYIPARQAARLDPVQALASE